MTRRRIVRCTLVAVVYGCAFWVGWQAGWRGAERYVRRHLR